MWYFTWVLGISLAVSFGVLNGIWYEFHLPAEGEQAWPRSVPPAPPIAHRSVS